LIEAAPKQTVEIVPLFPVHPAQLKSGVSINVVPLVTGAELAIVIKGTLQGEATVFPNGLSIRILAVPETEEPEPLGNMKLAH